MKIQNMEWENSFFSNQSNPILAKIDQDFLLNDFYTDWNKILYFLENF